MPAWADCADTEGMDANATTAAAGGTPAPADLSTLSDGELMRLQRHLEGDEKTLSRRRAVLHDRIDFVGSGVASEIYAAGDQLDALQQRERAIAEERRLLHGRIDAVRAEILRRRTSATPD